MNNQQEEQRSRIIPRWLEYNKTVKTGELTLSRQSPLEINNATKENIQLDLQEFTTAPTALLACRLMGAGIILGDEQLSHDMATYISKNGGVDLLSANLADNILNAGNEKEQVTEVDVRIASIRKWTSEYHRDAVAWIELARVFTIKGLKEKAKKATITALQLAPYDRYIVRCAVRFFLHTGDYESAWHYVSKASKSHFDPWIKATEVNVANISAKSIPAIKKLIPNELSFEQSFHFSELLESYGYLELESGNDRKAKKQMRLAWQNPSESVITHAEWIIRNKLPGLKGSSDLEFARSPEANTWRNYVELKLDKALEAAQEWALEEPYSKYPFIVGACIASNADKPEIGVEIAARGLMIDPNNRAIINNLCYALLRAGNTVSASKYIKKLYPQNEAVTENDLIALATVGLYEIKVNNIARGREYYTEVIRKFKQKGRSALQAEAMLNLAMAELDASTSEAKAIAMKALSNTERVQAPSVLLVREIVRRKLLALNLKGGP